MRGQLNNIWKRITCQTHCASGLGSSHLAVVFNLAKRPIRLIGLIGLMSLISLSSFAVETARAAPLRQVPVSFTLRGESGFTVPDGTYSIKFAIYTAETGGTATWSETQSVSVKGGVVSVLLGASTALPSSLTFNDSSHWLGITIESDPEMSPRVRIGSVPSAFNADTVDGAHAGTSADNVLLLDSSGNLNIAGRLISTGTPASSATSSLVRLGSAIAGGSSNGTYIGINGASGFSGNFIDFQVGGTSVFRINSSGDITIGGSGGSGSAFTSPVTITTTTTPQLSVRYDASNYYTTAVSSAGAVTWDATGGSAGFTVSDALTASSTLAVNGALTIGDASGDTVTSTAAAWTFANDTAVTLSGGLNGINFDSNTLSIDAANDRVGIGTAAPNATLAVTTAAVSGTVAHFTSGVTNVDLRFTNTDNANGYIQYLNGNFNFFANNGSTSTVTIEGALSGAGLVGIGTNDPSSRLHLAGNFSASAWGTAGIQQQNAAATYTDSSTLASGTATNATFVSIARPTLAATNTGVTTTNAATVYIANSPAAGTNQTLTNAYALWVDDGNVLLDGNLTVGGTQTFTGNQTISGNLSVNGNTTLGDASGDTVTVNAAAWTFANDTTVALSGGVNGINFDSNTLSIDALNNRVGIGTNAPTYQLQVQGAEGVLIYNATAAGNADLYLQGTNVSGKYFLARVDPDDTTDGTFFLIPNSTLNSAAALTVQSGGNVGIGDVSPAALLTVGAGDLFQVASTGNLTTSNGGTWTFSNDTNFALSGGVNGLSFDGTTLSVDALNDRVGIGTAAPTSTLHLAGSRTASAWGTVGIEFQVADAVFTDSSTAASGTAASAVLSSFFGAELAATNASVTTTNAATVYIQNAPAASGNMTITNGYALWIDAGHARFDGQIRLMGLSGGSTSYSNQAIVAQGSFGTFDVVQSVIAFKEANTYGADIGFLFDGSGYPLVFSVNDNSTGDPIERMRILNTGVIIVGNGERTTAPAGNTIRAPSGTGTNIAGGALTLAGGQGTGTGNAGTLSLQAAAAKAASGTTAHSLSTVLTVGNSQSAHPGLAGALLNAPAVTWTDANTAASGTATNAVMYGFQRPTLAATNTGVTTTNAATVYIANSPAAGTNQTLTNAYALWVDDGNVLFDGNLTVGGNTTLGDASGDTVTSTAAAWTFANDTTVALSGGVNGINFDANTLSIDATNDRVGIGTAAPSYALDVRGSGTMAQFGVSATASVLVNGSTRNLQLGTDGTVGAHIGMRPTSGTSSGIGITDSGVLIPIRIDSTGTTSSPDATVNFGQATIQWGKLFVGGANTTSANGIQWGNDAVSSILYRGETSGLFLDGSLTVSAVALSRAAWGINGIVLRSSASTFTDSSTAASGTATNAVFTSFATPTLAATNLSVTTSDAATVYIAAAPTAGTNQTITRAWSLWVDAGNARFDGNVGIGVSAAPATPLDVVGAINTSTVYQIGASTVLSNTGTQNIFAGVSAGSAITTGSQNTLIGVSAGASLTTGVQNTFVGWNAGGTQTTATENTFIGRYAGNANTSGDLNTFVGAVSGYQNTTGANNTFVGRGSGANNTTGGSNVFIGTSAGATHTTGTQNIIIGYIAGGNSTGITGSNNLLLGYQSGYTITSGNNNVAVSAYRAGFGLTTGTQNTFVGNSAGEGTTTASNNTFLGYNAGALITTGDLNTFVGSGAGDTATTASYSVLVGYNAGTAITTGNQNVIMGYLAGSTQTTAIDNTILGYGAGRDTTGGTNTFVGSTAGLKVTTATNTIIVGANSGAGTNPVTGNYNVVIGNNILNNATTATFNVLIGGTLTGSGITTGAENVYVGYAAGRDTTTASGNTALGDQAGLLNTTGATNVFIGDQAGDTNTTGSNNIIIGATADVATAALTNATAIGYGASVSASNTLVLGGTVGNAVQVVIGATSAASGMELDVTGQIQLDLAGTQTSVALCGSHTAGSGAAVSNVEIVDCTGTPAADYTEMYAVASDVGVGDVVALSDNYVTTTTGERLGKLTKAQVGGKDSVIGVVSGYTSDFSTIGWNIKDQDNPKPVALNGRVPVKVAGDSPAISRGDLLTISTTAGRAKKMGDSGWVVGRALEDWSPGRDTVMMFVSNIWYNTGQLQQASSSTNLVAETIASPEGKNLTITTPLLTVVGPMVVKGDTTIEGTLLVKGKVIFDNRVGVGTESPHSRLQVAGPIATSIKTVTADYTIGEDDSVVIAKGAITVTLPDAAGISGRQYTVKNTSADPVTVASAGGKTIDGATTQSLATQYQYITLISDGENWAIVASNLAPVATTEQ